MKKTIVLCALALGAWMTANAQLFEVRHNGVLLENDAEMEIKESEIIEGELRMKFKVDVTNISDADKSMRMLKEEESMVPGTSSTMCWDQCMDPAEPEATCETLPSGETNHPYAELILCEEGGVPPTGTSIINYTFKSRTKGEATITVKVKYTYEEPTKVNEADTQEILIAAQPAGEQRFRILTITAENVPTQLEIADLSGRMIQSIPIQAGQNSVTFTDVLTDGCYLLILKEGNKVVNVQKGVIK